MKNDDLRNHIILWGWVGITGIVLAIGVFPPKDSGDVASWFQGVGTIAAIFAAVWASGAAARDQRATRRTALKAELDAHTVAIVYADQLMDAVGKRVHAGTHKGLRDAKRILRSTNPAAPYRGMLQTSIGHWPSPSLFITAAAMTEAIELVQAEIDQELDRLREILSTIQIKVPKIESGEIKQALAIYTAAKLGYAEELRRLVSRGSDH